MKKQRPDSEWLKCSFGSRWLREKRMLYLEGPEDAHVLKHSNNRVVVPAHMTAEVLNHHHDSPFSGHRGFETTIMSIQKRYYWNFMPTEVLKHCQSCEKCQIHNFANIHHRAPMKSIIVTRPWQMLGLDFMGPFKTTCRGNTYIILHNRALRTEQHNLSLWNGRADLNRPRRELRVSSLQAPLQSTWFKEATHVNLPPRM